jgi:hypothetical protein
MRSRKGTKLTVKPSLKNLIRFRFRTIRRQEKKKVILFLKIYGKLHYLKGSSDRFELLPSFKKDQL